MITTNANWDTKTAALAKQPVYAIEIDTATRVWCTHDLTALGCGHPPADYKPWLKTPRGATQTIDVLRGTSSIGELECEVIDPDGSVRTAVTANTYEGKTIALKAGYAGLDYGQFVPVQTYQVYKILPQKGYTSWLVRSRDRQSNTKRTMRTHPENGGTISAANPWVILGTPAEIIQQVYLWALGRPASEVDRTKLTQLDDPAEGLFAPCRPFRFVLTEPTEAKQWLETEIYKVCGLYPVVNELGQISARAFRPPAAGPSAVFSFDEDNMTLLPEIDRQPVLNEIIFSIDHNGSDFQNQMVFIYGDSISIYGQGQQLKIESKGLQTSLGAQWFCQEVAARLFHRFGGVADGMRGGAPIAQIEAFLTSAPVWAGDYVNVSHPLMPDLVTGALGVTDRLYEVIDRSPDYANGKMRFKLLDTGLTGKAPAKTWSTFELGTDEVY